MSTLTTRLARILSGLKAAIARIVTRDRRRTEPPVLDESHITHALECLEHLFSLWRAGTLPGASPIRSSPSTSAPTPSPLRALASASPSAAPGLCAIAATPPPTAPNPAPPPTPAAPTLRRIPIIPHAPRASHIPQTARKTIFSPRRPASSHIHFVTI